MHTWISWYRSWHSCPRRMNTTPPHTQNTHTQNTHAPSMRHQRRRNVTTSMVELKKNYGHVRTNLTQHGKPQNYSWELRRRRKSTAFPSPPKRGITQKPNPDWSSLFVCWLLYVPATCECISGTNLLRQLHVLHTETEVADQTVHLTQSQYTDTGPTSPSTDPITPGAWQGSHWSANF